MQLSFSDIREYGVPLCRLGKGIDVLHREVVPDMQVGSELRGCGGPGGFAQPPTLGKRSVIFH
jgi:hypothetical protein